MDSFITLDTNNIDNEHICCAISDKKCAEGYALKKEWLKGEFNNGYVFRRLNARAKVFIEYGPAEFGWCPITAQNFLLINCFWVSGQYKEHGYGKALLKSVIDDAQNGHKSGLVTVVGQKKFPFMSDTKWLMKQGFQVIETLPSGFSLLALKLDNRAGNPKFNPCAVSGNTIGKSGIIVYYSNRCPFTEFHIKTTLVETAQKRNLALGIIKLETMEQAQNSPSPATIFSLYLNGKFITTDISVCMDSRFDKIVGK